MDEREGGWRRGEQGGEVGGGGKMGWGEQGYDGERMGRGVEKRDREG